MGDNSREEQAREPERETERGPGREIDVVFKRILEELVVATEGIRANVLEYPGTNYREGQGGFHYTVEPTAEPMAAPATEEPYDQESRLRFFFYIYAYDQNPWHVVMYKITYCGVDREDDDNRDVSDGYATTNKNFAKQLVIDDISTNRYIKWRFLHQYKFACTHDRHFSLNEAIWSNWISTKTFALECINDYLHEEIKMLRERVLELELRPPELGGPGYESAREHFENVPRHVFDNAL